MALAKIWVPIIGTGTHDDPWRPDVPKEVVQWMVANVESDPITGQPLQKHVLVVMDEKYAALCTAAKPEQEIDKESLDNLAAAEARKDIYAPITTIINISAQETVGN